MSWSMYRSLPATTRHSASRAGACKHHPRSIPAAIASQSSVPPAPLTRAPSPEEVARLYYELVWSQGRIKLLDQLMAENHEQLDLVWQPSRRDTGGRRAMKRGILAYRAAYPDICFRVLMASRTNYSSSSTPTPTANDTTTAFDTSAPSSPNAAEDAGGSGQQGAGVSHHQSEGMGPACSVFVHWEASGTNTGPIRGTPASHKQVHFSGISRLDFDETGKMCRSHVYRQAAEDEARHFITSGLLPWASGNPEVLSEA